jgi:hypothetical protein
MSELQDNPLRDLNNARNLPRDTPETDEMIFKWIYCGSLDISNFVEFSRRLERERDEARKDRDEQVKLTMLVDERRASAERESIERLSMCVKYKQERDEAREISRRSSVDWAEDHTHLQNLCRKAGASEQEVEE